MHILVRHSSIPSSSPGQTFFAVSSVVQFVVDNCSNSQRPRVTAQKSNFAAVQDPHGPLHIVQRPLQVGGLLGHPVQLQVQQGDAWNEQSTYAEMQQLELPRSLHLRWQVMLTKINIINSLI